ncbi:MAG: putative RNA-binding Zn-ribbon protein involved in translation (DUF1610 family) [Haloarculaceae archaeon]
MLAALISHVRIYPAAEIIMINNSEIEDHHTMTDCSRCGTRMSYNDETTKLTEYACPNCHNTEIVWKPQYRITA